MGCTAFFCRPLYLLSPPVSGKMDENEFRHRRMSRRVPLMRTAKPILLVTTPLGLLDGFYECYKLAGGLLFLMVAMVGVMVAALGTVIDTIRRADSQSQGGAT